MPTVMKIKSASGEFEVQNIIELSHSETRHPMPNHELGQKGHNLSPIVVRRLKSLMQGGKNKSDDELVKLAAALGEKAYFSGTIHNYMPTDMNNPMETITFERGHIIGIRSIVGASEIEETLTIVTTDLKNGDVTFKLGLTN